MVVARRIKLTNVFHLTDVGLTILNRVLLSLYACKKTITLLYCVLFNLRYLCLQCPVKIHSEDERFILVLMFMVAIYVYVYTSIFYPMSVYLTYFVECNS